LALTEFTINLPCSGSIMNVNILDVDDEPEAAELFRLRFRLETR
jgi:hypothetical protein